MSSNASTNESGTEISPRTLYEWIEAGRNVTILDVRGAEEYEEWHIGGETVAIENVPGTEFERGIDESLLASIPDGDPLIVVCAKGLSSATIAEALRERGIDAKNLADGMEGWATVYVSAEVEGYDGAGSLYQYRRPSSGCLGYLLVSGDDAAVFDPLYAFADRYPEDAASREADLRYAFDTHIHADHFSALRDLSSGGVRGYLSESAIERGVTYADEIESVADGQTIAVGDAEVRAIHTPGHTTGMTSYLIDERVLLTGDGLFVESVARPDLEAGDEGAEDAARQLYRSLQDGILTLDDEVIVASGHYSESADRASDGTYTATIADLKSTMPILSSDEESFVERVLENMPPRPANYETIIETNLGVRGLDAVDAFRLELGPNNCSTATEALTGE
ncbi:MAG: MBL fold metallo-hydrolase [Halanaeroarchaeum sp.]